MLLRICRSIAVMSTMQYTYETVAAYATHSCTWEIPKFLKIVENKNIREYRSQKSLEDSRPQLKLKFLGLDHDIIEIYYLFSTQERLKYTLKTAGYTAHDLKERAEEITVANKWHYMTKLFKSSLTENKDYYFKRIANNQSGFNHNTPVYSEDLVLVAFFKCFKENVPTKSTELSNNLGTALNTGIFSDVTIKSNDGKQYNVHKVILACRSAVLKAHFEHNTTECHTNIVDAPFDSEVLEEILSYIYSDKVARISEIPGKILAAADYYQLNELKSLCGKEMSKQLSVKNAVKTLELADLYREHSLKQSTLDFIKQGNAGLITNTEAWDEKLSVHLIKSIYEHIHCNADGTGSIVSFCDGEYEDEDQPPNKKSKSMICFSVV